VHDSWYWIGPLGGAWVAGWLLFVYRVLPWTEQLCGSGPITGILFVLASFYTRIVHRLRFKGFERLPGYAQAGGTGGFIVVGNHACGLDPIFIQCGLRRHLRWMMWKDMFVPILGPLWSHERMIAVGAGPQEDGMALREAIRHIRAGHGLGLFPEGGIARPPSELRPFLPGAGLLARLGKAPVLLFFIDRTGFCESAWGSIVTPSRTTVEFLGAFDLRTIADPAEAAEVLREALRQRSGWPLNDLSTLNEEQASTL
jgi:1-acyl-sn-glycerol-3-phosphate acyltransferase